MNNVVTRIPRVRNKKIACGRQMADMLRNPTTTGDRNQAAVLMTSPKPVRRTQKVTSSCVVDLLSSVPA